MKPQVDLLSGDLQKKAIINFSCKAHKLQAKKVVDILVAEKRSVPLLSCLSSAR